MTESKSVYPFEKGEFGVQFEDLPINSRGEVQGESGRTLIYDVREDRIMIEDQEYSGYSMSAWVSKNTLSASISTRKRITGERHPDFFAKRFLIFAYENFITNGLEIDRVEVFFTPSIDKYSSVNFDQYLEMISNGSTPENAARSTWAGKLAAELGFTDIENISIDRQRGVQAVFIRPDQK